MNKSLGCASDNEWPNLPFWWTLFISLNPNLLLSPCETWHSLCQEPHWSIFCLVNLLLIGVNTITVRGRQKAKEEIIKILKKKVQFTQRVCRGVCVCVCVWLVDSNKELNVCVLPKFRFLRNQPSPEERLLPVSSFWTLCRSKEAYLPHFNLRFSQCRPIYIFKPVYRLDAFLTQSRREKVGR